jgi:hypothetical protein
MAPAPAIDALVGRACPSIAYRLKREVLGQPSSDPDMRRLTDQIAGDDAMGRLAKAQAADGWIGHAFHGDGGHEAGIRLLCEMGVEPDAPVLRRAIEAVDVEPGRLGLGIGQAGTVLDATGHGGTRLIRAVVLAYAGQEARPGVADEVAGAVECLRETSGVGAVHDVIEMRNGRLVFRPGRRLPSIYHLRLLAWTHGWRTPESTQVVAEGVRQLIRLSPIPHALVRDRSRLVAPASFCIDDFDADIGALDSGGWMCWLHRTEVLARIGVVGRIPALQRQIEALATRLEAADPWPGQPRSDPYFMRWGAYTGLALERDWRSPVRRANDLAFRSHLILSYSRGTAGTAGAPAAGAGYLPVPG